jgi:hypothetical protein
MPDQVRHDVFGPFMKLSIVMLKFLKINSIYFIYSEPETCLSSEALGAKEGDLSFSLSRRK